MELREATEAEQRARDVVTHQAWGEGLTVEQFCRRELVLRAHPWARAAMTTWLWLGARGEVLASCETFEVPSAVGVQAGRSWSVASVFVEARLRGHGHALRMMEALLERLGARTGAQASVLFSEVGASLYDRAGYAVVPAHDVLFSADAPVGPAAPGSDVLRLPTVAPARETLVLRPSLEEADWHHARERFYQQAQGRPPLAHHAAHLEGSHLAWACAYKADELHVLWLETTHPSHRAPLISAAQAAARQAGLPTVRVWETEPLADLPGARRVPRAEALPMFAPLRPALSAWTQVHRVLWV